MKFSSQQQQYRGIVHEAFALGRTPCEWKVWVSPVKGKLQLWVERPKFGPKQNPIGGFVGGVKRLDVWNLTPSQFGKWLYDVYSRDDVRV